MSNKNYTGIVVKIGAAHDSVTAFDHGRQIAHWDRAEMRKTGQGKLQGELRRSITNLYKDDEERAEKARKAKAKDMQRKKARRNKQREREAVAA